MKFRLPSNVPVQNRQLTSQERDAKPAHALCMALLCGLLASACPTNPEPAEAPDATFGAEAPVKSDIGVGAPGPSPTGCEALLEKTCGSTCALSAACRAAELLDLHAPEDCEDALDNPVTFPRCTLNSCESLLQKTCGDTVDPEDAPCADDPGCTTAQILVARLSDDEAEMQNDEDTLASCLQALEDDVVFHTCEQIP